MRRLWTHTNRCDALQRAKVSRTTIDDATDGSDVEAIAPPPSTARTSAAAAAAAVPEVVPDDLPEEAVELPEGKALRDAINAPDVLNADTSAPEVAERKKALVGLVDKVMRKDKNSWFRHEPQSEQSSLDKKLVRARVPAPAPRLGQRCAQ